MKRTKFKDTGNEDGTMKSDLQATYEPSPNGTQAHI